METQKDTTIKDVKDSFKTKEGFCRYVFLKAEKLTSALYMITDFLSDNEPLKWKLSEQALDFVSDANSLTKDKKDFLVISGLTRVSFGVNNLVALLDVAYVGGTVSQMNLEILKREYQNLVELINTRLNENSFKKFISDENLYPSLNQGQNKLPVTKQITAIKSIRQKDTVNDLYGLNSKTEKKSFRKEQIINFLKDKSWTSITEIAKSLPDCGPKTVQRELLEMVSNHILNKQGERRWSRYMLA